MFFHAFTTKANGRANRIITPIKVCQAFDPAKSPIPPYSLYDTTALWDTGATNSVITNNTAKKLNLTPVGATMISHAGGCCKSDTHLVNFVLPNAVQVPGVLVSECPDSAGNFGVIIGMDIISQGDLAITNVNGMTVTSFRLPSIEIIDYVAIARKMKFAGIGRNEPCPCGKKNDSGKRFKFKQCCGR